MDVLDIFLKFSTSKYSDPVFLRGISRQLTSSVVLLTLVPKVAQLLFQDLLISDQIPPSMLVSVQTKPCADRRTLHVHESSGG